MTSRHARVGDASAWTCRDCLPELWGQGGEWGWRAHRYWLHGEGSDPGEHPPPAQPPRQQWRPWTDAERAQFHQRNRAARLRARRMPSGGAR